MSEFKKCPEEIEDLGVVLSSEKILNHKDIKS